MSNKVWTRNYDNLFSAVFGTWSNGGNVSYGTYDAPCVRDMNGRWYKIAVNASYHTYNMTALSMVGQRYQYNMPSSNASTTLCVRVGTGTGTVSKDDYKLFLPHTAANLTVGTVQTTWSYDSTNHTYTRTIKIPLAYSGAADLTVTEFGLYGDVMVSDGNYGSWCLMYHEFLDEPVTLHQNDTLELTFSQTVTQPNYTPYPEIS